MNAMFFHCLRGRARLALAVAGWAAAALPATFACAQEGGLVGGRASLPAQPLYSRDNAVTVSAPVSKAGYRAPVLLFVTRTREELERSLRLKLGSALCPLEVRIGDKSDGDRRVLSGRFREEDGRLRERIELPDPEAADLSLFRRAIFVAMLRGWMVDAGGKDGTMRDLPVWLIDGALRCASREARQADADRMLLLWSRACLPPAAELFAFDSAACAREPAVAAVLAAWLLEKRPDGVPFEALLRAAATGGGWDRKQVARLACGAEEDGAFDERFDRWLLSEGRQVIQPGVTTRGVARRFRAQLLLYPWDFGKTLPVRPGGLTCQEAAARGDDPAVRAAARRAVSGVRMAALGRDGTLLAVSDAYARFLEALAKGAKQGELSRLLVAAEGLRRDLERQTALGDVLRRPVVR